MSDYLISILLGIIEGLTEFLPVSSTAHLRIAEDIFGISLKSGYWKMYSIVIQLGAILAVVVYFRHRILKFLSTFPKGERGDRNILTHPLSLTMIAFVVTAIPALLLVPVIKKHLESLYVMGLSLLIGGVIMWIVDDVFTHPDTDHMERMSLPQAIWIGAVQILSAVFPGTSRSMSTIAAGQMAGMSRPAALEFSFFLSMPTMIVATGYELFRTFHPGKHAGVADPIHMTAHLWVVLAIGFVVSFFVAWAVIAWFMAWVRERGFVMFAAYRLVIGVGVLIYAWKYRAVVG